MTTCMRISSNGNAGLERNVSFGQTTFVVAGVGTNTGFIVRSETAAVMSMIMCNGTIGGASKNVKRRVIVGLRASVSTCLSMV